MNERMKKQIHDDYKKVLSTDAGLRVFGRIFYVARTNGVGLMTEYTQGKRDLGICIANTIREIDPHIIAECELAHKDFMKEYEGDERGSDDDYPDSGNY